MTESVDRAFDVPFLHRLRFTQDVLGADGAALAEVLERSGSRPARTLFFVDSALVEARGDLTGSLERFVAQRPEQLLQAGPNLIVRGGEACKNDLGIVEEILRSIHDAELDRRSYMVVIGGGAVLDAVGFAAGIAHRGIRLVRLPTTTLAQADSGVGVKNGVNFFGKKNWIGTFAVPWAVINDASLLATLPQREFLAGFAEVAKVSLLKDPALFARLETAAEAVRARDLDVAMPLIAASAELHLDHITRGGDPFEVKEARPLDFGHWSAHRLEVLTDFDVRHGEAVAIGVALDTIYSALVLGLPKTDCDRVLRCLLALGLPLHHPSLADHERLFEGLEEFRQHLGGQLTLTLLEGIGRPVEVHEVDHDALRTAQQELAEFVRSAGLSADVSSR